MTSPNNDDEDDTPTDGIKLAHPENRGLLAIISDILLDSIEHQNALKTIATAVRDSMKPVGVDAIKSLADEIRRDGMKRLSRADELDKLVETLRSGSGPAASP